MKSDSVDYHLYSDGTYPLTLAIFYDSSDMDDELISYLSMRLMDIYILKKEKILKKGGRLEGLAKNGQST